MAEAVIKAFVRVVVFLFRGRTKMPVAVVQEDTVREELKSLPGAYVVIRRMTYGERLVRTGLSGKMKIMTERSEYAGELEMATRKLALWDFQNLITEHNLQDKDERVLNFKNIQDIEKLSARVGEEVGSLIDKHNSFEDVIEGNS